MEQEYTIIIFTENKTGILSRLLGIITRRHINIESISASESSIKDIHKIILVIRVSEELVRKVADQIDKQIDVLKAFYYDNSSLVFQEIALYKVPTTSFFNGNDVESLVRKYDAKILRIEEAYIVIEKTGYKHETDALLEELQHIGIYEFVRSGRIAIVKQMEQLNNYLRGVDQKLVKT